MKLLKRFIKFLRPYRLHEFMIQVNPDSVKELLKEQCDQRALSWKLFWLDGDKDFVGTIEDGKFKFRRIMLIPMYSSKLLLISGEVEGFENHTRVKLKISRDESHLLLYYIFLGVTALVTSMASIISAIAYVAFLMRTGLKPFLKDPSLLLTTDLIIIPFVCGFFVFGCLLLQLQLYLESWHVKRKIRAIFGHTLIENPN